MRALRRALFLAAFFATSGIPMPAMSTPPNTDAPTTAAAITGAEIDAAIHKLADGDTATRLAAAQSLATTPPDAIPILEIRLMRTPEAGTGPMWLALEKAKKSQPDAKEGEVDLLSAVVTTGSTSGHRALALLLAGMKACEKQGGVAGARVLVKIAVDHKGMLKPYASAALRRMGDHAVAALVEVRRDGDKDLKSFANKTLDALGKFLPSDAVQVHDPQALADVLVAFGKTKDPDAMRVIVGYLNADRAPVRDAARWAIAQFGNDAKQLLKETYDAFTGDRAGEDWAADRILKALVAAYDKLRLAEVYKLLDEGVAHREAGRLEEAIASFDALLARAPTFERRAELAPTYVELARKLEPTDRPAARQLLAKASRLAVGTPLANSIEADLAYLDTLDLLARGVADRSLLERALLLDPTHARARDLLDRIEREAKARDDRLRRIATAGFVGIVVLLAAILFLGRKPQEDAPPIRRKAVRI